VGFSGFPDCANNGYLQALYSIVLNRTADAIGLQSWSGVLGQGMSRTAVALAIINSTESESNTVQNWYNTFLNRPADATGLQSWVALMDQGVRDEVIISLLVGSAEYFGKA
jgi:hypothetical protein